MGGGVRKLGRTVGVGEGTAVGEERGGGVGREQGGWLWDERGEEVVHAVRKVGGGRLVHEIGVELGLELGEALG